MKENPYTPTELNNEETNSAKLPFIEILLTLFWAWLSLFVFISLTENKGLSFQGKISHFFLLHTEIQLIIPMILVTLGVVYSKNKEYKTPDKVFVDQLNSPKMKQVIKAFIVLKKRKLSLSPFLVKLLPKLIDKSITKRSSAYSLLKKYYPNEAKEVEELGKSKIGCDLSACKEIAAPLLEKHGLSIESLTHSQVSSPIENKVEKFVNEEQVSMSDLKLSHIPLPNYSFSSIKYLYMQVLAILMDLLVFAFWIGGIVLFFVLSGWLIKIVVAAGMFGLGVGVYMLRLTHRIRVLTVKPLLNGLEKEASVVVYIEPLDKHNQLNFIMEDMGVLIAVSDGYKLITLKGGFHDLYKNEVDFVRISEKKTACAIDCRNNLGESLFDFVINPSYNGNDMDIEGQGELKMEWFLNHIEIKSKFTQLR